MLSHTKRLSASSEDTGQRRSTKFFLSYGSRDSKLAEKLVEEIRRSGHDCFWDRKDIQAGDEIRQNLRQGLIDCTDVLVILSPASFNRSKWVPFELGAAWALDRRIVVYLEHPDQERFPFIRDTKYITNIDGLREYLAHLSKSEYSTHADSLSEVEQAAWSGLYRFPGGHVKAVRLFGADDEFISEGRLRLKYVHQNIDVDPSLRESANKFVKRMEIEAKRKQRAFFNGPNTRLCKWMASTKSGRRSALEEKVLNLEIGPVSWYEYEGLNGAFREKAGKPPSLQAYEWYAGLSRVVSDQEVEHGRLSNILDAAATVLTEDGFIGYADRGRRVVLGGKLTSAVAENINRYLDDTDPRNSLRRMTSKSTEKLDSHYKPKGTPHPFATVRRGIEEELSPALVKGLPQSAIKLTGLSFDLDSVHPDALFVIAMPMRHSDVLRLCRENPGKDWFEGRLQFVRANRDDPKTCVLLQDDRWIPGGHASIVRALEVLEGIRRRTDGYFDTAFQRLLL